MKEWEEVIVSLSGVYEQEEVRAEMGGRHINLTGLAGTRFFCEDAAADQIRQAISVSPTGGLHWIDSGDYHYISMFWLERIRQPFTLLMMDHHSDLQESAFGEGLLSCGSWLLQSLRTIPQLQKVILVGPQDEEAAQLPSELAAKVMTVQEEELPQVWEKIAKELQQFPVYISFDKDILAEAYCVSGWSQGSMRPETAYSLIEKAFELTEVIGIDICGEAPDAGGGCDAAAAAINRKTNQYFRKAIAGCSARQTADKVLYRRISEEETDD